MPARGPTNFGMLAECHTLGVKCRTDERHARLGSHLRIRRPDLRRDGQAEEEPHQPPVDRTREGEDMARRPDVVSQFQTPRPVPPNSRPFSCCAHSSIFHLPILQPLLDPFNIRLNVLHVIALQLNHNHLAVRTPRFVKQHLHDLGV